MVEILHLLIFCLIMPTHTLLNLLQLLIDLWYRKGSNYSAKKNNSRRGLALELERKKSASIRVAPYIDCKLEP